MIFFQIALILLVAAPVLALTFYLWFQIEEYVRKKNRQDNTQIKTRGKRRQK